LQGVEELEEDIACIAGQINLLAMKVIPANSAIPYHFSRDR
jgi:hypothetical protein